MAYALSPIDLIPDFIPVLGYLDEVILLPVLIALTVKLIPQEVMEEAREQAKDIKTEKMPTKWYFATGVIVLRALVIWLIIKLIVK